MTEAMDYKEVLQDIEFILIVLGVKIKGEIPVGRFCVARMYGEKCI